MRAYFIGNMYLSSIQNGIQAGHCISELFVKYQNSTPTASKDLLDWATNHKTMILLNGGYNSVVTEFSDFLIAADNPYPWAPFFESEDAMGGMQTVVGIVLPQKIYETAAAVRKCRRGWEDLVEFTTDDGVVTVRKPQTKHTYWDLNTWEIELIERLNKFGMAK